MTNLNKITIIIPALNPDHKLLKLVQRLKASPFREIIIVNDGSRTSCESIFKSLADSCTILHHSINSGKGRALKTAFSYFLENPNGSAGVVTVDADGQHSAEDIKKVSKALLSNSGSLVLGVRHFKEKKVPLRSKIGNELTKKVFKLASGLDLSDTQTGLRGIPASFLETLTKIKGERFEFELNMLLACKSHHIPIEEVGIKTIYIEENESSHFQPIKDSIKIYSVFLKYSASSLLSFGLDIILFYLFSLIFKGIFPVSFIVLATVCARVLSSLFNYIINKNAVFQNRSKNALVKYFMLVIIQMLFSGFASSFFYYLIGNRADVLIKIGVDTILFFASFYIQKKWVFNKINKPDLAAKIPQTEE